MRRDAPRMIGGLAGVGLVTLVYARWLGVTNATTVALTFLLVVLVVAATSRLWVAVMTSIAAMLSFNFFFLPPVGTLTIADPQNWVALFAFLAVSLVASNLSSVARARAQEALARRDEVTRLFDLSRDVLLMTDSREAIALLARFIARRFDLDYVAICLPRSAGWEVHEGGALSITLDPHELAAAYAGVESTLEFDARARTRAGLAGLTTNTGPHGLTEILFAYTSSFANNGQTFAGLSANSVFYNLTTAMAMMMGRFGLAIPALALAGVLARQGRAPVTMGILRTDSVTFGMLLIASLLIVAGLSYLPALTLGPVLEHFMLSAS